MFSSAQIELSLLLASDVQAVLTIGFSSRVPRCSYHTACIPSWSFPEARCSRLRGSLMN